MSRDLKTLLHDAAPEPTTRIDERELVDKALRQRTLLRAGAAAAVVLLLLVVAGVLAAVGVFDGRGDLEIVGQPPQPETADTSPSRSPSGEVLPGGWSPAPSPLDSLDGEVTVVGPGSGPVMATGRDVAIQSGDGWQVRANALPAHPDVVAADAASGRVVAIGPGSATLVRATTTGVQTVEVPDGLRAGVLGAAWASDGFVVVGTASSPDDETPAYRLDPDTGSWTPLPGMPLAVNRPWNSSVVATADGSVVVTGAWLTASNVPARTNLAAAILPAGADAWRLVDGGGLSPQAADATPLGDRVLVIDYDGNAAWLDDEGWTRPTSTGADAGECPAQLAVADATVLMVKCHQGLLYDPGTETWEPIAVPTHDRVSLGRPLGASGRFIAPRVRLTVSDPQPHDLLVLDPDAAWPMIQGHDGMVAAPPGWNVAPQTLTPDLAGPTERITASTAAMPAGGDTCAQVPEAAMEQLGPGDALVSIQTRTGADPPDGAPRLGSLSELDHDWTDAAFLDCAANTNELAAYWTPAEGDGQFHYLLIVHHRNTPQPVIDQALAVANSFRAANKLQQHGAGRESTEHRPATACTRRSRQGSHRPTAARYRLPAPSP